jgi:AcrR family transcriptional regulator
MPRPSRNLDKALLAAGRALLPHRGCAGLSVREVAEAAGVNLGMFHYHFKTRDAFLRELLQSMYDEMFSQLQVQRDDAWTAVENLRQALRFLGRFLRANRPTLSRVLADALCGDPIALDFLRRNAPRHLGHLWALIQVGQKEGALAPLAPAQALGFCAGSLAMPIIFGGAAAESADLPKALARSLEKDLLSDAAIDQRIELALAAIRVAPAAKTRKKNR